MFYLRFFVFLWHGRHHVKNEPNRCNHIFIMTTSNAATVRLSIVIITYNRPDDVVELAESIKMQKGAAQLLDEVIIVNNQSAVSYQRLEQFIAGNPSLPFHYIVADENLGVSKGRNFAARLCKSEVMVFIDDDAVFQNEDAITNIAALFTAQNNDRRKLGIVSFKVLYYATGDYQQNAFPHKKFNQKKDLHDFETYYYTGCAHAINKKVFDHVGYYPENFFYGMEEYDLSYRTINEGYSIRYDDSAVILHKESPLGRLRSGEQLRQMWVNKCKIAWKYLPKKYFYSTAFMWTFEYLQKTKFDIAGCFKGWTAIKKIPKEEIRTPVTKECLAYLKQVEARLYY